MLGDDLDPASRYGVLLLTVKEDISEISARMRNGASDDDLRKLINDSNEVVAIMDEFYFPPF